MQTTKSFISSLLFLVVFSACQKEELTNWSPAENLLHGEELLMDIFIQSQYLNEGYNTYYQDNCAALHSDSNNEFTLVYDFNSNCNFPNNGRPRFASLNILKNQPTQYNHRTVLMVEYYELNNYIFSGKVNIDIAEEQDMKVYHISTENVHIKHKNNESFAWSCQQKITWKQGSHTTYFLNGNTAFDDDIYHVEGYSTYTSHDGKTYTATIITPIEKNTSCRWIQRGVMSLDLGEKDKQMLDFGDGVCNNLVLISVDRWNKAIHTLQ